MEARPPFLAGRAVALVKPGAKGFVEPDLGGRGKLRVLLCVSLRCRTSRGLLSSLELPPVLRAGLAYPVMELQLNPGQSRERPVHGFGRKPCHVATGRSYAGKQDFHAAAASSGTFFLQIIAVGRAGTTFPVVFLLLWVCAFQRWLRTGPDDPRRRTIMVFTLGGQFQRWPLDLR
jgi:hypothetical protein